MKLTILKENLKDALNVVERSTSKSLTLPILNNVLMETDGNFLCLSATDLEIGVKYWSLAKIEKQGKITVPIKLFSSFISSLHEKTITIELKNNTIYVKGNKNRATIKGLDPNEFPIIPDVKSEDFIEIDNSLLCQGISYVAEFCASSQIRPELSGVYFLFRKNKANIVATDSFRLAEKTISYESLPIFNGKSIEEYSFIIPQKAAREIVSIFGDKGGKVKIYFSSNQISFEYPLYGASHPQIKFVSRLVEGEYPNYKEIIPKQYKTQIIIPKNEFLNQIKAASLFSGKVNDVKIEVNVKKQNIKIFSQNPEYGEQESYISGKISGEDMSISFNFRFLMDGISNIKTKDVVFELSGEESPAILKPSNELDYLYIIMPIKSD